MSRPSPNTKFTGPLDSARLLIEPEYYAEINMLPTSIRHVACYHIGWWDRDGCLDGRLGKMLRPALALTCAAAAGSDPGAAMAAAVAVEMVHDSSLLHHDVMDGAASRRRRSAAWALFGVGQAIRVGDALLATAMARVCAAMGPVAAAMLVGAVQDMCANQYTDLEFKDRDDVDLAACLTMAEQKTGALFGAACQLGAFAAGRDECIVDGYRRFGRLLGLAFQLADDLLGIWGEPSMTGKPAGADLFTRKRSLPVVAALTSETVAGKALTEFYRSRGEPDQTAVDRAAELVLAAGGSAWARAEADRRLRCALDELHAVQPSPVGAADLRELIDLIRERTYCGPIQ